MLTRLLIAIALLLLPALPVRAADINSTVAASFASSTNCLNGNTTSLTCNKPPSTVSGHLLIFDHTVGQTGETITCPSGFTSAAVQSGNSTTSGICYKIAGGSEPSSYTISYSIAGNGDGVLMDFVNANATSPLDGTSGMTTTGNQATYSIPAPTAGNPKTIFMVCGHESNTQTLTSPSGREAGNTGAANYTSCWVYTGSAATANISANLAGKVSGEQVGIAPLQVQTGTYIAQPAIIGNPAGFSADQATGTVASSTAANPLTGYSDNGCFNPVAYGADPSGSVDSSAALNATVAPACAAQAPICVPAGTFRIQTQPWLIQCPSGQNLIDVHGKGRNSTIFVNELANANSRGGGIGIEVASNLVASDIGGFASAISAGLVGGGNSWNTNGKHEFFNLNYPLNSLQPLNGLAQLDVQHCFSTTSNSVFQTLSASEGSATPKAAGCNFLGPNGNWTCKGAYGLWIGSDGKLYGALNTSVTGWSGLMHSTAAVGTGTTVCAELSYDGSNVRLYHGAPNTTMTEDAKQAQTGTVVERQDEDLLMLAAANYWHEMQPAGFFQGQMDTSRISNVARCTNDAGCTAPNAKLTGDSNTILLENWTNVSNLPLVGPEWTGAIGSGNAMAPKQQAWMAMQDAVSGNPGSNWPEIGDFAVIGGAVGIHVNTAAPHFHDLAVGTTAGSTTWGLVATGTNAYGIVGRDIVGNGKVPMVAASGLTYLYGLNLTCGFTCGLFSGPEISGISLLTPGTVKWGMIVNQWAHVDNYYDDAEAGGTFPAILASNMAQPISPIVTCTNCQLSSQSAAAVQLDGNIGPVTLHNAIVNLPASQPVVDATNATVNNYSGAVFDNVNVGSSNCPGAGQSFINNSYPYSVTGGCTEVQTTTNGTSAGSFTWSEPVIGSGRKTVRIYLNGYENTTGTAQTFAAPVAFTDNNHTSSIQTVAGTCTGITINTAAGVSTVTLPSSMGATQTGLCEFNGS